jgi:hypothetical protein
MLLSTHCLHDFNQPLEDRSCKFHLFPCIFATASSARRPALFESVLLPFRGKVPHLVSSLYLLWQHSCCRCYPSDVVTTASVVTTPLMPTRIRCVSPAVSKFYPSSASAFARSRWSHVNWRNLVGRNALKHRLRARSTGFSTCVKCGRSILCREGSHRFGVLPVCEPGPKTARLALPACPVALGARRSIPRTIRRTRRRERPPCPGLVRRANPLSHRSR